MGIAVSNPNTDYELLAREVYAEILQSEGMETVRVEHNVRIKGRSGQRHQIDVYWEFKAAGVTHRVAIECKNYTNPVSVGAVRNFSAALDDIGNIQGIFITKIDYQEGAKRFAEHQGIALKKLRDPTEEELRDAGAPPKVVLRGHIYHTANIRHAIRFDVNWVFNNTPMKEGDPFEISALNSDIVVEAPNGEVLETMHALECRLPKGKKVFEDQKGLSHEYVFEDAFLMWPGAPYGRLKLHAIRFTYDILHTGEVIEWEGRWAAKAVLEDIMTGEIHLHGREPFL